MGRSKSRHIEGHTWVPFQFDKPHDLVALSLVTSILGSLGPSDDLLHLLNKLLPKLVHYQTALGDLLVVADQSSEGRDLPVCLSLVCISRPQPLPCQVQIDLQCMAPS